MRFGRGSARSVGQARKGGRGTGWTGCNSAWRFYFVDCLIFASLSALLSPLARSSSRPQVALVKQAPASQHLPPQSCCLRLHFGAVVWWSLKGLHCSLKTFAVWVEPRLNGSLRCRVWAGTGRGTGTGTGTGQAVDQAVDEKRTRIKTSSYRGGHAAR